MPAEGSQGTHSRQDSRVEEGSQRSASPDHSNVTHERNAPYAANPGYNPINQRPVTRSALLLPAIVLGEASPTPLHQQQPAGSSSTRIVQPFLPSVEIGIDISISPNPGQMPRSFQPPQNAPDPNQQLNQFQNGEMGRNYGSRPFSVEPFAHGIGLSVGIDLNLPASNLGLDLHLGFSSSLHVPPLRQPPPHNPLGVALGPPSIPVTHDRANNPNWQPQQIQQSNGLPGNYVYGRTETNPEIHFEEVLGPAVGPSAHHRGGVSTNNQTLFPNTPQNPLGVVTGPPSIPMTPESANNPNWQPVRIQQSNGLPGNYYALVTPETNPEIQFPEVLGPRLVAGPSAYHPGGVSTNQPLFPNTPQNPLGAVIGPPSIPVDQGSASSPNWQPQIQRSNGLPGNYAFVSAETTPEIQFEEVVGPIARARANHPSGESTNQTLFPNTPQQGMLGLHPNPHEMGESLSRNVRMRTSVQDNILPSLELQLGRSSNPVGRGRRIRSRRRFRNLVYRVSFERRGLPLDPHMRLFCRVYDDQGNNNGSGSI